MKLSIIIPVYNVEKYIKKCLLSVINQESVSERDYEIIIVNDGSPDSSLEIANELSVGHNNITIISQDNGGLSAARNTGFKYAKGDYVWYVDSDDWIESYSVKYIIDTIEGSDYDFITIAAQNTDSDQPRHVLPLFDDAHDLLTSDLWKPCAVFYVCKRSFLQSYNLSFYRGIFHEDSEYTPRLLYYASKCKITNKVLYHVYVNPTSICRSSNSKKSYDNIIVANSLCRFVQNVVSNDELKIAFYNRISRVINNALANISSHNVDEKKRFDTYLYSNRNVLVSLKKSKYIKYKIEYYLFCLFPGQYSKVYNLFKKQVNAV